MRSDRGSVTIWMLGLVMVMLAVGGLALDLWRILGEKHRLELIADRAAATGSGALDPLAYRDSGLIVLDEGAARLRALEVVNARGVGDVGITTAPTEITVALQGEVSLSLLKLLLPDDEPVTVCGTATAFPAEFP